MKHFVRHRDRDLNDHRNAGPERRQDFATRLNADAWRRASRTLKCRLRNRLSSRSILDPNGPVLSLTTHGRRFLSVYIAIESIAAGSRKPSRCILWLNEEEYYQNLPDALQRLVSRGLEVRLSENFGPHTKYYPYISTESGFQRPLVTADDDMIYPQYWLERLVSAHESNPGVIHCYRAHRMRVHGLQLAPYNEWHPCVNRKPSFLNFVTGVAGAIYPTKFLHLLKRQGPVFLKFCPKADDVWLTVNALRGGFKVAQVDSRYRLAEFSVVPGSQIEALYRLNVAGGGNQLQLLNTLTNDDLVKLGRVQEEDRDVD